jgi:hypothetical protein
MWALSIAPPFSIQVVAGAGGYFSPHIRAYIRRSGAPPEIGAMVAVKDRRNGALNPYAHLQQPDITLESVQASPMLWDPVRYDETCPSSDGACAVVIGDEEAALASPGPVAWIRATAMRTEPTMFAGKDPVNPAAGAAAAAELWRKAGITSPIDEVDVAEIYVPFSWFEPMWLENLGFAAPGDGWRLTAAGETALGGKLPVNPSGGVLSSNPIGASGLLRFAEAAMQVMGKAGAHQVAGARTALGHAYGGGSQYFSMWVVSSERLAGGVRLAEDYQVPGVAEHGDGGEQRHDERRAVVAVLGEGGAGPEGAEDHQQADHVGNNGRPVPRLDRPHHQHDGGDDQQDAHDHVDGEQRAREHADRLAARRRGPVQAVGGAEHELDEQHRQRAEAGHAEAVGRLRGERGGSLRGGG